jgi:HSP20 family protein
MAAMTLRQVASGPTYRLEPARQVADWLVPVDIEETDDAYIVDLDLPNAGEEDVQIELRGNELRIFGAFRDRGRSGILRRQGRRVGEFEFLVTLPGDIDADGVDASLEHGVLRVRSPKARGGQAKRIAVHNPTAERPPHRTQPSAGQAGAVQRSS